MSKGMKRLLCLLFPLVAFAGFTGCDVHEFPALPETVSLVLRLDYDTDMTEWEYSYDNDANTVTEEGLGETYDNSLDEGSIRYVVHAYPQTGQSTSETEPYVFEFSQSLNGVYDYEATIDLVPGDYEIMVWSDLSDGSGRDPFYNADDFAGIALQGEHAGNSDYRDAFRGSNTVTLVSTILDVEPDTLDIGMQRPLAKYEFITTDLAEFVTKEQARLDALSAATKNDATMEDDVSTKVNIEDYKIVFYYVGFMPNEYSIFTDKPVDSATGVLFESELSRLSTTEASVGFDYVFVNGVESAVTIQIGIYDSAGTQLSLTDAIKVPVKRNHHTVMRGSFLMSEASGGISIDPGFDGDYNLVF